MADNTVLNLGLGGDTIATKDVAGVKHELVALEYNDGAGGVTEVSAANPLPVSASINTAGLATSAKQDTEISALASILAKIIAAPATEATVTSIEAQLSSIDFATQTTVAAILAKLISNPATDTLQTAGNTSLSTIAGKDFATQTTLAAFLSANHTDLAAILSKLIANPATDTLQSTGNTSLSSIDGKLTTLNAKDFATQSTLAAVLAKIIAAPATESKQDTGNTSLASIDTKTPALGQALAAASTPVVLTAAQVTALTPQTNALTDTQLRATPVPVSGTVTATPTGTQNVDVTANTIGLSTAAKQDLQTADLDLIAASASVMDDWDESDRAKVNPITGQAGVQAGAGVVTANTQRVVIATDQAAIPVTGSLSLGATDNTQLYSNTLSVTGAITGIDTTGYQSIIAQLSGTWIGNMLFEGSNDNSTWNELMVMNVDEFSMQDSITNVGIYQIKSTSKYIRLNVLQLQTGSVTVLIFGRTVVGISGADLLSYAMDKTNNTPLYTQDITGSPLKDINSAAIPSDAPKPIYGAAAGLNSVLCVVDTTGYQSLSLQTLGTFGATISFQASNDGISWSAVNGNFITALSGTTINASSTTSTGVLYLIPTVGKYFRAVNTAYSSGLPQVLIYLRQQNAPSLVVSQNIHSIASNTVVTAGLNGMLAVGGNIAAGVAPTANPVLGGGIDTSGLTRRILTDTAGRILVGNTDQGGTVRSVGSLSPASNTQNIAIQGVTDLSQSEGQSQIEILSQILLEMRINNQYLYELPMQLQKVFESLNNSNNKINYGFPTEPQEFRNDPSIFNN